MKKTLRFITVYVLTLMFIGLGLMASALNAQYFGRNKVQYEHFDFKVLKTEHFDIYYYPEMEVSVKYAARMAERWYARYSRLLNHELRGRQPLILYSSSPHFQQTAAIPGVIGEGTGGVTEMLKRRIVLPLGASLEETDHVIGHELVHAFQFDITSQGHTSYGRQAPTALRLPLWFIEGMAEYLSIGAVDAHTSMWMRDATRRDKLPTLKMLMDTYKFFPYRYGQALWSYITGRWGDQAVERIMKGVRRAGNLEGVLKKVTGLSPKDLSAEWHASLKKTYEPLIKKTQVTQDESRILFKGTEKNRLNISPALSPDGQDLVFLSSRDLFSIDLFQADAKTGKIKRKLLTTAVDPHFDSLQFIKSAGTWDAEGKYFLFAGIQKGQPVISIMNVEKGKNEKEIVFPEMGEILNPTWSPDERFIAFSALIGGLSDLFIYDLNTETLKRMTEDPFADLYPAWSPDGQYIAFSTDRFSTDLSILSMGSYELALMDPESGEITKVSGFEKAKNINPQWTADSKSLYFLSDQNGISNVYRIELESQKITQITNLYTGASGITDLSPALSVAQKSGRLAYCVYEENNYSIYSLDASDELAGQASFTDFGEVDPSVLPPRTKSGGELLGLLKNPIFGLPRETEYEVNDYKPKLSLDYISPPALAAGVDRYGTYAGGGLALFFSDMLGYRSLYTMFQISSRLIDSAALVGYVNSRSRLNWGLVAQRIPYVYSVFRWNERSNLAPLVLEELIIRQIYYQVGAFSYYPFSQVSRFELSAGYQYIDYDFELYTYDSSFREIMKQDEPAPPGLGFGYGSIAYVYDTALWGATGPILGQSYRLEFSPYIGSIDYFTVLADYRRYLMPARPFTLAFRFLHYGRYGKGANDDRLYSLYLGYESLVRGFNRFDGAELDVYRRLFGSKLAVANLELRFPLFQILGIGKGYYGILPTDFYVFFDAGVAWYDNEDKPTFLGGDRKMVSSAGFGIRTSLMQYFVLGLNLVHPFDRPEKGWVFQLTISPGF